MLEPTEQANQSLAACQCPRKIKGLLRLALGFTMIAAIAGFDWVLFFHFIGGLSWGWLYANRLDIFIFTSILATPVLLMGELIWIVRGE